jgi:tRNA U34 5-carboxymethylaminomethyl modifying GTPase MnmE/TrmE
MFPHSSHTDNHFVFCCTSPPLPLAAQAENVLALVNARTAAAADSALAGLQGGLGQLVSECRRDVLSIITELEARLDFDEDLPPLDVGQLKQDIAGACGTQS